MITMHETRALSLTSLFALSLIVPCAEIRAERVGYKFSGTFQGSSSATYTLFGITVPRNSAVKGTFSYDTTAPGVDTHLGERTFLQEIHGGYTLDINNSAIQLSMNEFYVKVANDFQSQMPVGEFDLFDVQFDANSAPNSILVNGLPWSGPAIAQLDFRWPSETFTEPDEPKLTADRPLVPGAALSGFVGSPTPRPFSIIPSSILAIVPSSGDYNYNDAVDAGDHAEWRRAFDETNAAFLFADGNNDGIVDAADYVVWRHASVPTGTLVTVPEPTNIPIVAAGLFLLVRRFHRFDG